MIHRDTTIMTILILSSLRFHLEEVTVIKSYRIAMSIPWTILSEPPLRGYRSILPSHHADIAN